MRKNVQITYFEPHNIQISWKGDRENESLVIKLTSKETMKKWAAGLRTQCDGGVTETGPDPDVLETNWAKQSHHGSRFSNTNPGPSTENLPGSTSMSVFVRSDLKVQRHCISAELSVTARSNTKYQALVDIVGPELLKLTNKSDIGQIKLRFKYLDEDGDHVVLENDDDIKIAIASSRRGLGGEGSVVGKEIKLFCTAEVV